ncbi:DUF4235 domain-containing protein [Streptomyces erythrochromogenes]|uniref:DUF4235 domain-containing protein n=1 Tax=Streptomyces erythrochromogenes TaxID=285574 RepID=UPI0036CE9DF7
MKDHRPQQRCPDATDENRTRQEVLLATPLQGAIPAVVKAAADHTGTATTRRLTGT